MREEGQGGARWVDEAQAGAGSLAAMQAINLSLFQGPIHQHGSTWTCVSNLAAVALVGASLGERGHLQTAEFPHVAAGQAALALLHPQGGTEVGLAVKERSHSETLENSCKEEQVRSLVVWLHKRWLFKGCQFLRRQSRIFEKCLKRSKGQLMLDVVSMFAAYFLLLCCLQEMPRCTSQTLAVSTPGPLHYSPLVCVH